MAELATGPKKASRSIKSREVDAGSEGAARNTLATALIVLSVAVGLLLVWQTFSSLLVIFAGFCLHPSWMLVPERLVQSYPSVVSGD